MEKLTKGVLNNILNNETVPAQIFLQVTASRMIKNELKRLSWQKLLQTNCSERREKFNNGRVHNHGENIPKNCDHSFDLHFIRR